MDCTLCQQLKVELNRLECIYGEKLRVLRGETGTVLGRKHRSLQIAVNDAWFDLETVRAQLNRHSRGHQATLTAP